MRQNALGVVWCQTPSPEFWFFIKGCHAQGRCQSDLSLLLLLYPCARRSSGSTAWHWGSGHPRLPESHSPRVGAVFWRCLPSLEEDASLRLNVPSSCLQGTFRPFFLWKKETNGDKLSQLQQKIMLENHDPIHDPGHLIRPSPDALGKLLGVDGH